MRSKKWLSIGQDKHVPKQRIMDSIMIRIIHMLVQITIATSIKAITSRRAKIIIIIRKSHILGNKAAIMAALLFQRQSKSECQSVWARATRPVPGHMEQHAAPSVHAKPDTVVKKPHLQTLRAITLKCIVWDWDRDSLLLKWYWWLTNCLLFIQHNSITTLSPFTKHLIIFFVFIYFKFRSYFYRYFDMLQCWDGY